jgi:alpha-tubulin suppressor-like RCC1 family protein
MTVQPTALRWQVVPAVLISATAALGSPLTAHHSAVAEYKLTPSIAAGNAHSCVIDSGRAYCWGENDFGQLGDGSTASSSVPVAVDTSGALAGKTLTQISAGGGGGLDTCALDSAGAAYCWGSNFDGALGDGDSSGSYSSVPVLVDSSGALAGKTLTEIAAGSDGGCVLDSLGAAFCWGDNDFGELGNGSTDSSSVPVAVTTSGALAGRRLTQISAGFEDTCGLDRGGVAFCWGDNAFLELGDGGGGNNDDFSSVPVAVDTRGALAGQTLTGISAGWWYECAVDAAGAAFCWGTAALGDGQDSSNVPVAVDTGGVLAGQTLTQISAGYGATCALDRSGASFCWGDNTYGELGNASTMSSSVPVAVDASGVLAGKTLTQITAGAFHVCAEDTANAAYCWGDNNQGDLGNGSTTQSDVPVLTGPRAPRNVAAKPGDATAAVSWSAPPSLDGGTLTGYTASASPGGRACMTSRATACTITGLTDDVTYRITVVAHTTAGDSGASAPVTVTPVPPGTLTGPILSGYRATACVDDSGNSSSNGTKIVMWDCDGSAQQKWAIWTDGTVRINGKCLDIYRYEAANRTRVELWTCTGGSNQQWRARNATLVNPASGKCLDDPGFNTTDGTSLQIYTCNGGRNQKWQLR